MANVNKVILIGRLTADPELRHTQNDKAVTEFGFAVNRKWKTAAGEVREDTMFIQVVAWMKTAENVCQYLAKGSTAYIEGRLTLDEWDDRETGKKRRQHKVTADVVQFLDRKKDGQGQREERGDDPARDTRPSPAPASAPATRSLDEFDLEDDVPF